jgi:hypothetical protein
VSKRHAPDGIPTVGGFSNVVRRGDAVPKRTGRPPESLRQALRDAAGDRLYVVEQILDSPDTTVDQKLKAMELALRFGIGAADTHTIEVARPLSEQERIGRLAAIVDRIALRVGSASSDDATQRVTTQGVTIIDAESDARDAGVGGGVAGGGGSGTDSPP